MNTRELNHTAWDCKYHVVWIPKYRKKELYGKLRKELGPIIKELAGQKESEMVEGDSWWIMSTCCSRSLQSMPYAQVVGFIKGKSAI